MGTCCPRSWTKRWPPPTWAPSASSSASCRRTSPSTWAFPWTGPSSPTTTGTRRGGVVLMKRHATRYSGRDGEAAFLTLHVQHHATHFLAIENRDGLFIRLPVPSPNVSEFFYFCIHFFLFSSFVI